MAKVWIPADRFIAVLDRCNVGNDELDKVGVRRLWDLRNGRQEAISLDVADGILTKLGLTEWMHLPKKHGGLGELYFGEEVFTPSWVSQARAVLDLSRPARKKYHTDEERLQAGREKSRRSAHRLNKRCACGTRITNNAKACQPCYLATLPRTPHGTVSRYSRYKCRCPECRSAAAAYHKEKRRRWQEAS